MAANLPYPKSQLDFIKRVWASIDVDPKYFERKDWRNIAPHNGRHSSTPNGGIYADAFYVKPVAVWVPHMLIPNHVPSCPHCKKNKFVTVTKARWINSPKMLYGMSSHRYLDTMLYPCGYCRRTFTGYNPDSLKLDAEKLLGMFNFHQSGRFAVDEQLFSFIISSYDLPTTTIHRILKQMACENYINDFAFYLHAVRSRRIKEHRPNVSHQDGRQRTLHATSTSARKLTGNERTLQGLRANLQSCKLARAVAVAKTRDPICFHALRRQKAGRNARDALLPGVGVGRIQELITCGIVTGRQMVEYNGIPVAFARNFETKRKFERWRKKCRDVFEERVTAASAVEQRCQDLEEQVAALASVVEVENAIETQMEDDGELPQAEAWRPPMFSKWDDKDGYNVRVLSTGRIDQILMTDFLHRKPMQQSKMVQQPSEMLKLDSSYKFPKKVHVYKGVGQSFRPYVSMCVIQNEFNQTVLYKMCQGPESIKEMTPALKKFRDRNTKTIKVIYVDNCCQVRTALQEIFPEAAIKLDPFHWFMRWDELLLDSNSEEASIFRAFMRRAVFEVDDFEYARAEAVMKGRLVRTEKEDSAARAPHPQTDHDGG